MSDIYGDQVPHSFAPGSFTPPENYGVAPWELLRQQMEREAQRGFILDCIKGGIALALAMPSLAAVAISTAAEVACNTSDKVPAVVCETNQTARQEVGDFIRRLVGISEPPSPFDDYESSPQ